MTKIKINSPFLKKRTLKLHWFGNVYQDHQNNWRIQVGFEEDKQLTKGLLPIGVLPILRLGQWYHDGIPLDSQKEGNLFIIEVPNQVSFQVINSLDTCQQFNYYLHRDSELIKQMVISFTINGVTCYIPQVELIRSLFALHKNFCNAILRPNGLSLLVKSIELKPEKIDIEFTKLLSLNAITPQFIKHFVWLVSNPAIYSSFESVFYQSIKQNEMRLKNGVPLSFVPPSLKGVTLTCRGKIKAKEVLILEVIGFDGLDIEVDSCSYKHPYLKERIHVSGLKKRRISKTKVNNMEIDSYSDELPGENTREPIIEQQSTKLGFNSPLEIIPVKNNNQTINKGNMFISWQGQGGATSIGAVDESVNGGKLTPVDVRSLDVQENKKHGLESFLEMIELLRKTYPEISPSTTLLNLPLGRRFSILPDGQRRKCAVVKIEINRKITYILEVACPDGHSLSTLILYLENGILRDHENRIQRILRDLVFNQGHWDQKSIRNLNYVKLRHVNVGLQDWAERMYKYI